MSKTTKKFNRKKVVARTIVVPIIEDPDHNYLICKMPKDRGVFPGQWGLPGGGIEPGETMYEALAREIKEELGNILISEVIPWTFREETHIKTISGNKQITVRMIFLLFTCMALDKNITLNDEFEAFAWVPQKLLHTYDLNQATLRTFKQKGLLALN